MSAAMRILLSTLIGGAGLLTAASYAIDQPAVTLVAEDPAFSKLLAKNAQAEWIADDLTWAEGPACLPDGQVIFSDIPKNRVVSWTPSAGLTTWLTPAHFQNGHAVDKKGRVLAASHGERGIVRQTITGHWDTLVDKYQGKRLNSPNDLVMARDGSIWFTDPTYGIENSNEGYGGKPEVGGKHVYRYVIETKKLTQLQTPKIDAPNGLAFSPDEKSLYVSDSKLAQDKNNQPRRYHLFIYPIEHHKLGKGRIFAELRSGPDGIKVDERGNVWSTSAEGIQIFNPAGKLLGKILIPANATANLAFCTDANRQNWVYITASQFILRAPVLVKGAASFQ